MGGGGSTPRPARAIARKAPRRLIPAPGGRKTPDMRAHSSRPDSCRPSACHLVDLSWPVAPGMPMYPGDPPMALERMGSIETHGWLSHRASLPAHSGTHMDAPAHVLPGGATLAELPLTRFAGPGAVLDLRQRAAAPFGPVTEADLAPLLPAISEGAEGPAFLLLMTGIEALWPEPERYYASGGLTEGAARLLAAFRAMGPGLSGIGLDCGSADTPDAPTKPEQGGLPAHRALLGAGLVIVENLRGLADLPQDGFTFLCLPILGLDGSPVRAAALVPGPEAEEAGA